MLCPYCQKEMLPGYIQCRDGLTWTQYRQPVAALSSLALLWERDSIVLSNDDTGSAKTVHAHRCIDCQKVIIDYSSQPRPIV